MRPFEKIKINAKDNVDVGINYKATIDIEAPGTVTITFASAQFIPPSLQPYITSTATLSNGQVVVTLNFQYPVEIEDVTGVISVSSETAVVEVEKTVSIPIPSSKAEVRPIVLPEAAIATFTQTFNAGITNISPPAGINIHAHSFFYLKNVGDTPIYIGDAVSQPLQLAPNEYILLPITTGELDVTTVFINSNFSGQVIVAYK